MPSPEYRVGDTLRQNGQGNARFSYVLTSRAPYVRRDGKLSEILTWEGVCGICSAPFSITTPRQFDRLERTCSAHRGRLSYAPPLHAREVRHGR